MADFRIEANATSDTLSIRESIKMPIVANISTTPVKPDGYVVVDNITGELYRSFGSAWLPINVNTTIIPPPTVQIGVTATTTVLTTDRLIVVDASGAGGALIALNLPAASTLTGIAIMFKRSETTAGQAVTITPSGAEQINGSATYVIGAGSGVVISSDGSNWWTIASH